MILTLFEPDIPQNTGTLLRFAACLDLSVHIIHPCGFVFSDKHMARAAMDYIDHVNITHHDSWEDFTAFFKKKHDHFRFILLTTSASNNFVNVTYTDSDVFILGRESSGVTESVKVFSDLEVKIPMKNNQRSLNVAMAAAMIITEACRQNGKFL